MNLGFVSAGMTRFACFFSTGIIPAFALRFFVLRLQECDYLERCAMRKLHISKTNRQLLGVCGGIAETYDLDPTVVRLTGAFLCLVTAVIPVAITYLIAYFIILKAEE